MEETAKRILGQVPKPFDIEMVMKKYPVLYEQSMNTVLIQEVIRYDCRNFLSIYDLYGNIYTDMLLCQCY